MKFIDFILGIGAGFGLAGVVVSMGYNPVNRIPQTDRVEPGYVIPGEFKMEVRNLKKREDGLGQTIINYKGKEYLFTDEGGRPVAKEYEIVPIQIKTRDLEGKAEAENIFGR